MEFCGVSRSCSPMTKISPVHIWRRNIYGRLGFNFDFFWPRDPRTEISLPKILLHSKTNWKLKKSFYSQLAYVCQDMQLFSHKDTTDFYLQPSAGDLPILVTLWIVQLSGILAANLYQLFSLFICPNIDRMDVNFIEKFVDDPLSYCPLWEPNHPTFYPLMAKATPPEEEADLSSQKKDQ